MKVKIGITPPDAEYHYVNIMGFKDHDEALKWKKLMEEFLEENQ